MIRLLFLLIALVLPAGAWAREEDQASKPIIIRGVVDAIGHTAHRLEGEAEWTEAFSLVAWRVESADESGRDGAIRTHPLRVEISGLSDIEIEQFEYDFEPRTLVRFAIKGSIEPGNPRDLAKLADSLKSKPDAELRAVADSLLNPPPFVDEQFGTFTPDQTFPDRMKQDREWLGAKVTVTLNVEPTGLSRSDALAACAETMRTVWQDGSNWDARMREAIASAYYETWLENWREEGRPAISRDVFKAHFKPKSITFSALDGFTMIFADGDLFAGHGMAVSYNPDSGSLDVSMFG